MSFWIVTIILQNENPHSPFFHTPFLHIFNFFWKTSFPSLSLLSNRLLSHYTFTKTLPLYKTLTQPLRSRISCTSTYLDTTPSKTLTTPSSFNIYTYIETLNNSNDLVDLISIKSDIQIHSHWVGSGEKSKPTYAAQFVYILFSIHHIIIEICA